MEQTSQQKIKAITDAYLDSLLVDRPSEDELASQQVLSDRFLRRMNRLVRKARRQQTKKDQVDARSAGARSMTTTETPTATTTGTPAGATTATPAEQPIRLNSRLKKRLLVAVIILTILASAVGVSASREVIVGFIVSVFERFSTIVFNTPTETTDSRQDPSDSNDLWSREPSVIPAGYHQTEQSLVINSWQIIYANEAGQEIIYAQMEKSTLQMIIDTEGTQIEEMTVKGYKAIYYANKGMHNVIWEDDRYAYTISGIITKDEIIRMANSTMD